MGPNQIRMPAAQNSEHDASQIRGLIKEKNPGLFLISFLSFYTARPFIIFCVQYVICTRTLPFKFSLLPYTRYTHKTSGFKTSDFKTSSFKTSGFKTSGLQNVRFTKRQVSKRLVSKGSVFRFDTLMKQKV